MIPARAGKLRAFQYSQSYTRSAARDGGVSFPSGCRVSVLRRLRSQTRVDPSRVERPFRFKLVDPSRYSDSSRPRAPREPYARYVWNVCAYARTRNGTPYCPAPYAVAVRAARVRDRRVQVRVEELTQRVTRRPRQRQRRRTFRIVISRRSEIYIPVALRARDPRQPTRHRPSRLCVSRRPGSMLYRSNLYPLDPRRRYTAHDSGDWPGPRRSSRVLSAHEMQGVAALRSYGRVRNSTI